MFLSRPQTRKFITQYLGNEDTVSRYLLGIKEVGVPRIFYCEWLPEGNAQERAIKKDIIGKAPNCCYNHRVGLPELKFEGDTDTVEPKRIPLMGFNQRMLNNYHSHKRLSQNKCRGSGSSEMLNVRWQTFKYAVLNKVQNHKCIVAAGTRQASAVEFLTRMKPLLDAIPSVYDEIPSTETPSQYKFKAGGRILAFPASPSAIRGQENVGDIILEECAHWQLLDDIEVYRASEFVYTKTRCHILHLTTPRGKRGFYYNKVWAEDSNTKYFRHTINWREVTGLPVRNVQDLFDVPLSTAEDILEIRQECANNYANDPEYRKWFDNFFHLPFEEIVNVPNVILDVNHIIEQAQISPDDYDQELDNQFIAGESRAIGNFAEQDYDVVDMRKQLEAFDMDDFR